jgi:hypothetical protein
MPDQNVRRVPFLGVTFLRASKKGDKKLKIKTFADGQDAWFFGQLSATPC